MCFFTQAKQLASYQVIGSIDVISLFFFFFQGMLRHAIFVAISNTRNEIGFMGLEFFLVRVIL